MYFVSQIPAGFSIDLKIPYEGNMLGITLSGKVLMTGILLVILRNSFFLARAKAQKNQRKINGVLYIIDLFYLASYLSSCLLS